MSVMLEVQGGCLTGVCWSAGAACLALCLSGCSSSSDTATGLRGIPPECTILEPGEPVTLAADAHVLGSEAALGRAAGQLTRPLLADGGDVYWYDAQGSVFVERQGNGQPVELRRAEPPSETEHEEAIGLAANADRVFVGYGYRINYPTDSIDFEPPGRLLSLAKQTGQAEVLLELTDRLLAPVVADAEHVIVFAHGRGDSGFYRVPLAAPRLEPLPLGNASAAGSSPSLEWDALELFHSGQLVGSEVYWPSPEYAPPRLLRSGFDDLEPQVVLHVSDNYSVGPGYVLTQEDVWLPGYYYAGKDFLVRDESGCRAVRGSRGALVRNLALDAQFAYWVSSGGQAPDRSVDELGLTRVDLASGAVSYLTTPSLASAIYAEIVGQDAERLFLRSDTGLFSLRKR